ncbi:MAG: T9SS type A sorting domain-containing protein, partial [Flavobacteriales bacterium]|nr:T9SS type A sorting domain-containing protein [Flavobacteriales bacterium]
LRCRWDELRQTVLHTDSINAYLDSMESYLAESQARNFTRWPVMGIYLWPNSSWYASSSSHSEVIGYMKTFIEGRSVWMDNNMPGVAQYCELYEPPIDTTTPPDTTAPVEIRLMEKGDSDVYIYPNPSQGLIYVHARKKINSITVVDMIGRIILKLYPNAALVKIDLNNLKAGIYLVRIESNAYTSVQQVFIH